MPGVPHAGRDGRLAAIRDIYVPGRDSNDWVDRLGTLTIIGAIGTGLVHGTVRLITRRREKQS